MNESLRVLVVDDEKGIRFFLRETLQREGHAVSTAESGEQALECLREDRFDLILLDLKLGGRVDGLRVLEAVKWRWPATLVIILTAHGSLDSAMAAIREGVDGYLLKPAEPGEVRQAVKTAWRQRKRLMEKGVEAPEPKILRSGPFIVDLEKHSAAYKGEPLDLTTREFTLLIHLMQNAHRVVDPIELVEVVQGYNPDSLNEARESIRWYVHRLRQKLEPYPSTPKHILNVRGVGYRFEA